jgi:hypothetical protein
MGLKPARGYSPRDIAACHARLVKKLHGPRPGGSVQRGKWPVAQRRGTRVGRAHCAVTTCNLCVRRHGGALASGLVVASRWQSVADEHRGSSGGTPSMVTGNDAHQKGVTDDEADRWREAAALVGARELWWSLAVPEGSYSNGGRQKVRRGSRLTTGSSEGWSSPRGDEWVAVKSP